MHDTPRLSAHDILAIPINRPERLFSRERGAARREFRILAQAWHPDRNASPQAHRVFSHLKTLYEVAKARLENGVWHGRGSTLLRTHTGRSYRLRQRARARFELGETLLADTVLAYCFDRGYEEQFEQAVDSVSALRFADTAMQQQMAPALPAIRDAFHTPDGKPVLVLTKAADMLRLSDVIAHCGGALDPRHAAWIIGASLNLACYLDWAGIAHNGFSSDSLFVSPQRHAVSLLGGWWYAVPLGAPWATAPATTVETTPADLLAARTGDARVDLNCIRALGRAMLGDPSGALLTGVRNVPRALAEWLNLPAGADAQDDYAYWQMTLDEAFGPRRFVPWPLTAGDIYR